MTTPGKAVVKSEVVSGEIVALSVKEAQALRGAEAVIERGAKAFVAMGAALDKIREEKLYRAHGTFAAYVEARWGLSERRAYQLIGAASVAVKHAVDNEGQARALAGVVEGLQAEVLADAKANGKVTAKAITKSAAKVGSAKVTAKANGSAKPSKSTGADTPYAELYSAGEAAHAAAQTALDAVTVWAAKYKMDVSIPADEAEIFVIQAKAIDAKLHEALDYLQESVAKIEAKVPLLDLDAA